MVARMLWPVTLCLLGVTLTAATRDGKAPATGDAGDWSDAFEDSECDDAEDDFTYWTWLAQREAIDGQGTSANYVPPTASDSSSGINQREFAAKCFDWHGTREQEQRLAAFFGISISVVKRLKRNWGLTFIQAGGERPTLPSDDELQALWDEDPCLTVESIANRYGVCPQTIRNHLAALGFQRTRPGLPDDVVRDALLQLTQRGWCSNIGLTFAEAELRRLFGIVVSTRQIKRCLAQVDPEGRRVRAKEAARLRYQYNVPGPRSLYHADAHEKLAKIWGIWIHLCIDGYSRFIIYLVATTDKRADTVQAIFVEGCNKFGWASRVRWDKGTENKGAVCSQIMRMGLNRGSALTGRSSQNCRAEYIWNFVKRHVTSYFRKVFFGMQNNRQLDPNNPQHLFCLQAVFMPIVQMACDDFRSMWNAHRIRGQRTVVGHGGGIPSELFLDPVASQTVMNDDHAYNQNPESYGVEEPFRGDYDDVDLGFVDQNVEDPLWWSEALQNLRQMYFLFEPLNPSDGVAEYLRYQLVCEELRVAAVSFASVGDDAVFDWEAFGASVSLNARSGELQLRLKLAWLALNRMEM